MQVTRDWTERPHGALLQPDIDFWHVTYRIVGRRRNVAARPHGVVVGIPTLFYWNSNETSCTRTKTDTGRRGENPKVRGKTLVKELGKMHP